VLDPRNAPVAPPVHINRLQEEALALLVPPEATVQLEPLHALHLLLDRTWPQAGQVLILLALLEPTVAHLLHRVHHA